MKKIIILYGLISGAVIIGSMIIGLQMASDQEGFAAMEWLGYLIMIVALSMIFVGVKRYRDQELGGVIRFKTAALVGIGIATVASLVYVVAWEANLSLTDYAFIDQYTASMIETKKAEGVSGAKLEALETEMAEIKVKYGNPLFRLPMTFLEIFPVGLLIALLAAALLRNNKVLPAEA